MKTEELIKIINGMMIERIDINRVSLPKDLDTVEITIHGRMM